MPGSLGLPSLDYAYPVASFPSYPGPHSHLYQPSNPIFLLCSDSRHCPHPPPWLCLFPLLSNSTCSSSDLSPSPVASVLSLGCPNVAFLDPCLSNTLSAPLAALSQLPLAQGEVLSRCALFPPTPPPPASHEPAPPAGTLEVRVVGCKNLPETIPWSPPLSVGASGTPESRTPFLSRPARGLYSRSGSLSGRSSLRGEAENASEWPQEAE